jgi:hypothetical protein
MACIWAESSQHVSGNEIVTHKHSEFDTPGRVNKHIVRNHYTLPVVERV